LSFQTLESSFQVIPLRSQAWLFRSIIIPARFLIMKPGLVVTEPRFQVIGRRFIIIPDGWLTTKPVWEASERCSETIKDWNKYYIVPVDGADNPLTPPSNTVNFAAG
jgi:hypothetical protein